jgi:hypothetical protein
MLTSSNKCYSNWFSLLLTSRLITNGIHRIAILLLSTLLSLLGILSDIPIPVLIKCYNILLSLSLKILNEENRYLLYEI